MFAILEIARIYKPVKFFADLQGPSVIKKRDKSYSLLDIIV